ncbi:putative arginine--tRNA ligase, mitochondrial [Pseudolycoriella hygida]|uniref:Probable arginine--tRNA ligase, mitochondrial n=1 Tax=Pseudolycoriella hygida TaxID=35572 RepID=A0A9Q0MKU4_9DIPT|nr:putative arginine--tRNA ligase, mitochondrial [Pseudolycoriella hygida]
MNYLGDWGTQFGLLKIGMELNKLSVDEIKSNPITQLFNAYVKANQLAATDPNVSEKARNIFCQLENGETTDLEDWMECRKFTVEELKRMYKRLGIEFDEYAWESEYRKTNIEKVINLMNELQLLQVTSDGKTTMNVHDKPIPILKSDGTTLYVTRDVAAVFSRYEKYRFDEMMYVVENGQHDHFNSLFGIAKLLHFPKVDQLRHVKFGRISKMSTRKGNVVFLKDVLDDAQELALETMEHDKDTKIDIASMGQTVADILGTSSVIINDLKLKRSATYEFDLEKASKVVGDTGYNLQYTHCRLCRLEEIPGVKMAAHCNPTLLQEPEAVNLIYSMAKAPDILKEAKDSLEAHRIVHYTFQLCKAINKAHRSLNVKNESNSKVQEQRLLLFATARSIVNKNMRILGLQPLERM